MTAIAAQIKAWPATGEGEPRLVAIRKDEADPWRYVVIDDRIAVSRYYLEQAMHILSVCHKDASLRAGLQIELLTPDTEGSECKVRWVGLTGDGRHIVIGEEYRFDCQELGAAFRFLGFTKAE